MVKNFMNTLINIKLDSIILGFQINKIDFIF